MKNVIYAPDFCLSDTLMCGQCFRWAENAPGVFSGVLNDKNISISQSGDYLTVLGCNEDFCVNVLVPYLSLNENYSDIKAILREDKTLSRIIDYCPDIRVLHQDFWETLCSFIISQNNNIPRIVGIVERLCINFGTDMGVYYSFPKPHVLSSLREADLSCIRCGFRARYIIDAAEKVSSGIVASEAVNALPLDEARKLLMTITGVGPKVADCVLLFGCARYEAFPKDVWIIRAMELLFPEGLPEFVLPYAGIAQQYIYHYSRTSPDFKALMEIRK